MTAGCACSECVGACESTNPGWFMPGEAELAAELLELTPENFFAQYLGIDFWEGDPRIYVLAPVTSGGAPGEVYPWDPFGRCVLLGSDQRCKIYGARPYECREYIHTDGNAEIDARHEAIRDAWRDHQEQISELLRKASP